MTRRRFTLAIAGTMAAALSGLTPWSVAPASAQAAANFPDKPIRLIVPFAAGGATDVIARTVAQAMSERLGQTVLVENKTGANGNIGAVAVARAEPDGYTLLMASSSHAVNATLYAKLDYNLIKDFAALSNLASVPLLLVVNPEVPAKTVQELAAYAKTNGAKLNYGSGGVGTGAHLSGAQFSTLTGATAMTHIPYKGGAQALQDLVGGQVQVMFGNLPEMLQNARAGRLRPLALTGSARQAVLPDVPTFAEAGFPQIQAQSWFGMFCPAGTPAPIIKKLSEAIAASVAMPAVQEKLKAIGAQPIGDRHEAFQPFVAAEVERWGVLVRSSGATAE